jgi:DNA-binding MarR family transcriptional regulator
MRAGFRALIDDLHAELAAQGHPGRRPAYGFAMQAIGLDGATASEVGRLLGISKQAAGKTIDRLGQFGYAERGVDARDGRRKLVRLTPLGIDALVRSAAIFEDLRARSGPAAWDPGGWPRSRPTCARWSRRAGSVSTCPAGSAPEAGEYRDPGTRRGRDGRG